MKYLPTPFANLVRAESGTYFLRAHVHGVKLFRSLQTKSIETAKWKLDRELSDEREKPTAATGENVTLGQLITDSLARATVKPVTLATYRFSAAGLDLANPDHPPSQAEAAGVTTQLCEQWMAAVATRYSAGAWNIVLLVLRNALRLAVERGLLRDNPCKLKIRPQPRRERELPTPEQLAMLFKTLKAKMRNRREGAYYLASFLCYSGFRLRTARAITPAMVDRKGKQFKVEGSLLKTGTPGRIYRFPILPKMEQLLREMDAEFGSDRPSLLPTRTAFLALQRTCRELKIPMMNHHAFRHVFTTYCIAQGVPVPILAQWRGDRDGGRTLLRVYHHLLDDTSRRFAATVKMP